jgi:hypothetical protein
VPVQVGVPTSIGAVGVPFPPLQVPPEALLQVPVLHVPQFCGLLQESVKLPQVYPAFAQVFVAVQVIGAQTPVDVLQMFGAWHVGRVESVQPCLLVVWTP